MKCECRYRQAPQEHEWRSDDNLGSRLLFTFPIWSRVFLLCCTVRGGSAGCWGVSWLWFPSCCRHPGVMDAHSALFMMWVLGIWALAMSLALPSHFDPFVLVSHALGWQTGSTILAYVVSGIKPRALWMLGRSSVVLQPPFPEKILFLQSFPQPF